MTRDTVKRLTESDLPGIVQRAEAGDADAQTMLGTAYQMGHLVRRDETQGIEWWRRAADRGYAPAQYNLSLAYKGGDGVKKNQTEAVQWFHQAAEQGLKDPQIDLTRWYEFEETVKSWRLRRQRDASLQVELPEEARKFRVQAEFAVKERQADDAIDRYADALRVAPWWPEGHFNRALLLGEQGRYLEAIQEMNRYLKLEPEAPDARAARDRIYQWEGPGWQSQDANASKPRAR